MSDYTSPPLPIVGTIQVNYRDAGRILPLAYGADMTDLDKLKELLAAVNEPCDVCGNTADETGALNHGRGCYVVDEDGGGRSFVDLESLGQFVREHGESIVRDLATLRDERSSCEERDWCGLLARACNGDSRCEFGIGETGVGWLSVTRPEWPEWKMFQPVEVVNGLPVETPELRAAIESALAKLDE